MNAFLRNRTAFGFKYLISFHAEHSDADRDIKGIEGLLFQNWLNRGEKIVSKIQSWQNKWTRFLKFSRKLGELVGRKLEMVPNQMFQQLNDKMKKKSLFYDAVDAHARRRLNSRVHTQQIYLDDCSWVSWHTSNTKQQNGKKDHRSFVFTWGTDQSGVSATCSNITHSFAEGTCWRKA